MRWILVVTALIALTLASSRCGRASIFPSRMSSMTAAASSADDGLEQVGREFFRDAPFVVLAA